MGHLPKQGMLVETTWVGVARSDAGESSGQGSCRQRPWVGECSLIPVEPGEWLEDGHEAGAGVPIGPPH